MIKFLGNETLPLDVLQTFPGNANVGDVKVILESIRANGVYRSLIIRKHGKHYTIMAGNHTKLAMVEHGSGRCEPEIKHLEDPENHDPCGLCHDGWDAMARCEVYECDDQTALRINLVDNRSQELSHRDDDALTEQLMLLEQLTGSGFSSDDLQLYMPQAPPDLEEMATEFGEPDEEAPVWPTLVFKVSPAIRDDFLAATEEAEDPSEPVSRFVYLVNKAYNR